jgi:DNA repair exonuclease SbcCD ATPase subunit
MVLKKSCNQIENDVNKILRAITDFTILLRFEDSIFDIMLKSNEKTISANLGSGSQKFIVDFAIRTYLASNHPCMPNFLIIDEGFGCFDAEHLNGVRDFLIELSMQTNFAWVMIISHIEELQQISGLALNIVNENGLSKINFGGNHLDFISFNVVSDDLVEKNGQLFCSACELEFPMAQRSNHLSSRDHLLAIGTL